MSRLSRHKLNAPSSFAVARVDKFEREIAWSLLVGNVESVEFERPVANLSLSGPKKLDGTLLHLGKPSEDVLPFREKPLARPTLCAANDNPNVSTITANLAHPKVVVGSEQSKLRVPELTLRLALSEIVVSYAISNPADAEHQQANGKQ